MNKPLKLVGSTVVAGALLLGAPAAVGTPGSFTSETAKQQGSVPSRYGGKAPGQFVKTGTAPAAAAVAAGVVTVPAPEREGEATMTALLVASVDDSLWIVGLIYKCSTGCPSP